MPAVTHLWKIQRALTPLIRCMPSDLWVEEEKSKLVRSTRLLLRRLLLKRLKIFCRAIRETDWQRYDFYASKIIQLGTTPPKNLSLLRTRDAHPTTFMALAVYRPARSLLPNLRSFRCTGCTIGLLPAIQGFIGPKLINVDIDPADMYDGYGTLCLTSPQDLDFIFSSLPRLSPFIQHLDFRAKGRVVIPPIFTDTLRKLRHLMYLRTNADVPPTLVGHLASLPPLEAFHSPTISRSNVHNFTTNHNQFSNLKWFSFSAIGIPISSLVTMLDSMHCQFLQLGLLSECCGSLSEVASLVASLHRHPSKTSLKWLMLAFRNPPGSLITPFLTFETFSPLFSFSALTSVSIEPIALDDYWLREIAQTWPNLQ